MPEPPRPPFTLLVVLPFKTMVALPKQLMPGHGWLLLSGMAVLFTPLKVTVAPSAMVTWVSVPPVPVRMWPLRSGTFPLPEDSVTTLAPVVVVRCM